MNRPVHIAHPWRASLTAGAVLVLLLLLTGCAGSFVGRAPETRTLLLPYGQRPAYQYAQRTMVQMGAQLTAMDNPHAMTGVVQGAVILHVTLAPEGTLTRLTVTATIPSGKLILGTMTELDTFCQRMQTVEHAHVH